MYHHTRRSFLRAKLIQVQFRHQIIEGWIATPRLKPLLRVPQREIEYWLGDDRDCWLIIFKSGVASIVYCVPLTSVAPRLFTTFIYCLMVISGKKVVCCRIFRIRPQRHLCVRCTRTGPKHNVRPSIIIDLVRTITRDREERYSWSQGLRSKPNKHILLTISRLRLTWKIRIQSVPRSKHSASGIKSL